MRSSPSFSSLQYQDAGNYICETTLQEVEGLKKSQILTLIVQGNVDSYYSILLCLVCMLLHNYEMLTNYKILKSNTTNRNKIKSVCLAFKK